MTIGNLGFITLVEFNIKGVFWGEPILQACPTQIMHFGRFYLLFVLLNYAEMTWNLLAFYKLDIRNVRAPVKVDIVFKFFHNLLIVTCLEERKQ